MKTYSKLQILEVFAQQRQVMQQDDCGEEFLDTFDLFVDDFVAILQQRLRPVVPRETLLIPGFGFVPVVGEIGKGCTITYYGDEVARPGGETC